VTDTNSALVIGESLIDVLPDVGDRSSGSPMNVAIGNYVCCLVDDVCVVPDRACWSRNAEST